MHARVQACAGHAVHAVHASAAEGRVPSRRVRRAAAKPLTAADPLKPPAPSRQPRALVLVADRH